MRLGVLDVGSNTVHLLVVDAYPGARPMPAFSHKTELRLADHLDHGSSLSSPDERSLRDVVVEALRIAEDKGVEDLIAFATSAVREAKNGEEILARLRDQTGAQINVMTGHEEARLTFLAARRWFGWSSGRLLVIDIGGGSLEVASGSDEEADAVASLPLGAGRLTRDWIPADPPPAQDVRRLRKHVRAQIGRETGGLLRHGAPDHVVGTSKTFRQLARIAGAAPSGEGPYVKRVLRHADVAALAERLPKMSQAERAKLPGVSASRVAQLPAGAIVADATLDLLDVDQLELCPWALREGVILRRLDMIALGLEDDALFSRCICRCAALVVAAGHEADAVGVLVRVAHPGPGRGALLRLAGAEPGPPWAPWPGADGAGEAPAAAAGRDGAVLAGDCAAGDCAGGDCAGGDCAAGAPPGPPGPAGPDGWRARLRPPRCRRTARARRSPGRARRAAGALAAGDRLRGGLVDLVLERHAGGLRGDERGDPVEDVGQPLDRFRVPGGQQVQAALRPVVDGGRSRGGLVERLLGLRLRAGQYRL